MGTTSDHGWKLGEYGSWCKHTNMELDTRAPMIVAAPGMKAVDRHTKALVEFVDIYPSLCDLAGLSPPDPPHTPLAGRSFAPLLDEPDQPWKAAAFSQFPRARVMGYSMRTDRYHMVRWVNTGQALGDAVAVEVYDHQTDPGERHNLAADSRHLQLVQELTAQFRKHLPAASR